MLRAYDTMAPRHPHHRQHRPELTLLPDFCRLVDSRRRYCHRRRRLRRRKSLLDDEASKQTDYGLDDHQSTSQLENL
jgi:hypothetical protein